MAGQAVAFGLTKEQALPAITLGPARIMGIDKDYGSLEAGKSAPLAVRRGNLLDMRANEVTQAYIDGRYLALTSKQVELDKKFRAKYGLEEGTVCAVVSANSVRRIVVV